MTEAHDAVPREPVEAPDHFYLWLIVIGSTATILALALNDWARHENVAAATVFSAHHPRNVRWTVHAGTLATFGLLLYGKPSNIGIPIATSLALVALNALAMTRIVLPFASPPYSAVAGLTLDRVELLSAASTPRTRAACYSTFSRSARTAIIDGTTLDPPFLPLPIEWSQIDPLLLSELMCVSPLTNGYP